MQNSKEWQAIQKKYKDDKQKLQQEQMKLYQEMGINPLGSCLPLLIQFPIIIGLYQAIIRAFSGHASPAGTAVCQYLLLHRYLQAAAGE